MQNFGSVNWKTLPNLPIYFPPSAIFAPVLPNLSNIFDTREASDPLMGQPDGGKCDHLLVSWLASQSHLFSGYITSLDMFSTI